MTTAAEQLNNAMVALDSVAPPEQTEAHKLVTEWLDFWNGPKRALLPELVLASTYNDFLRAYTVQWLALGDARGKAPDPRRINPDAYDAVKASLDNYTASLATEAQAVSTAYQSARKDIGWLLVLGIGGLLAFAFARRSR